MLKHYVHCALLLLGTLLSTAISAQTLKADFRHRPPEMLVDSSTNQLSGPLKDIIEEAAQQLGHSIDWSVVPFARSLNNLKSHGTDIVPRVIRNDEREEFVQYVGPISEQVKNIMFVTRSDGPAVTSYADLSGLNIGVKRGTAYFKQFDQDNALRKVVVNDDFNLARMLQAKRIDAIVVLDMGALEAEFKATNFTGYNSASYFYPNRIGNYYGMPKNHPLSGAFSQKLDEMVKSGRVAEIYSKYGLTAQ